MFSTIWHTLFFDPVYNGLVFFIDTVPGGDVGLAIVFTVIVIKVILLPLSIKAAKTQKIMREIEPQLREVKETHKDDREAQAKAMMAIYKEAGMNPFSSILVFILQIPIIIALYLSVYGYAGVALPEINIERLYAFLTTPDVVNMQFLGLIDMAGRSALLALLAGITMYYQMQLVMPAVPPATTDTPDFKADLMRNLQLQMKYVMPVIIVFVAYIISAAIALYFVVSNVVAILQEFYVRRHR